MKVTELLDSAQYITDRSGEKTGVVLDLEVWQELLALVEHSDELNMPTEGEEGADQQRAVAMAREESAFQKLHPSLYPAYAGQYVAIYHEQLVDSDPDQVALYRRVRQSFSGEFVWIAPVKESPIEVLHFRSPRFQNGHS